MTNRRVAIIALLTIAALMGSSIAEARKYKRMSENCFLTGRDYNRIMGILEAIERKEPKLKQKNPRLAAKVKIWVTDQKAQVHLARVKALKAKIAKLKKALAKLQVQGRFRAKAIPIYAAIFDAVDDDPKHAVH